MKWKLGLDGAYKLQSIFPIFPTQMTDMSSQITGDDEYNLRDSAALGMAVRGLGGDSLSKPTLTYSLLY